VIALGGPSGEHHEKGKSLCNRPAPGGGERRWKKKDFSANVWKKRRQDVPGRPLKKEPAASGGGRDRKKQKIWAQADCQKKRTVSPTLTGKIREKKTSPWGAVRGG